MIKVTFVLGLACVLATTRDAIAQGSQNYKMFSGYQYSVGNWNATGLLAGDWNMDGNADIVQMAPQTAIFFGDSAGGFGSPTYVTGIVGTSAAGSEDFNNDGTPDLVVGNLVNTLSVVFGVGDGTFINKSDYSIPGQSFSIATADFNLDGSLDFVSADT
ncbi:MAG: VCBS repeat-containing protein [Planctomycetes bacterium]|nr:VCBS repeat-containing protein [Planctomycetota bacterium]